LEGRAVTIAIPAATARKVDEWLAAGYAVTIRTDEIVVTPPGDMVAGLRAYEDDWATRFRGTTMTDEAADLIEAQAAEIAALKAEVRKWRGDAIQANKDALAAEQEAARLRDALQSMVADYDSWTGWNEQGFDEDVLEDARAALAATPDPLT
jgi:hypothetical protein